MMYLLIFLGIIFQFLGFLFAGACGIAVVEDELSLKASFKLKNTLALQAIGSLITAAICFFCAGLIS